MTSKGLESFVVPMCSRKPAETGSLPYKYALYPGWISSRRFLRQMQKDNIDFSLVRQELVQIDVKSNKSKFKSRLLNAVRGPIVQLVMCSLVLIDALIVTAEIILEIHAVKAEKKTLEYEISHRKHEHFEYFCEKDDGTTEASDSFLMLNGNAACCDGSVDGNSSKININDYGYSYCCRAKSGATCSVNNSAIYQVFFSGDQIESNIGTQCSQLSCCMEQITHYLNNPHSTQAHVSHCHFFHTIACILHFISIAILCLFILQLIIKIGCMGKSFFKLKFEVVDGSIIMISLVADVIFVYIASDEISLIIVFLVWRIVRVINSLLMHEKQRDEFRIQLQKRARRISELKVESLNARRILSERHIDILESLCLEMGIPKEQLMLCRPNHSKTSKEITKNALRSMAFLTSEMLTQFAVGPMPLPKLPKEGMQASLNSRADTPRPSIAESI